MSGFFLKRILDFVISLILLFFLIPLIIIISLIILLTMGRSIFFIQRRPGLNNKPFNIYKFRTMVKKKYQEQDDFERLTRFGKFLRKWSLDEIPQLFNILKGDLSLVGPRPLLMEYLQYYDSKQIRRHDVKPGLTGWAQVNGRNLNSWEKKFELDLWYVENHNLLIDLKILMKTFIAVVKSKGVNFSLNQTMPKFTGTKGPVSK